MGIECPRIVFRRALEAFWAIEHAKLYDRTKERLTQQEVERIRL
jgi:hypothetical protein